MVAQPIKELVDRLTVESRSLLNRIKKVDKAAIARDAATNIRVDATNTRVTAHDVRLAGIDTKLVSVNSKLDIVEDFMTPKSWSTWEPTFPATSGQTFTGVTITTARYIVDRKTCTFVLRVVGTVGGTIGHSLSFTLPVPAFLNTEAVLGATVIQDTSYMNVGYSIINNRTTAIVRKSLQADGATTSWVAGANKRFYVTGTYEIL